MEKHMGITTNNKRMSEYVCDIITGWIMDGTISLGEHINEETLAERIGVSRMPIREALRILESRGLIESEPYVGAHVKELSTEEIQEIYELRSLLEPKICKIATERMDKKTLIKIKSIQTILDDLCNEILLDDSPSQELYNDLYRYNREFHFTIYEASQKKKTIAIIDELWDSIAYKRLMAVHSKNYPERMKREHYSYISLIENGEADKLMKLMDKNIRLHLKKE